MGQVQGKMLVHVSEAVLKRHALRRDMDTVFGPEGYRVEWRLLRAPVERPVDSVEAVEPISLTFDVQASETTDAAPPAP